MSNTRDRSQDAHFGLIKTLIGHSAVYGLLDFAGRATPLLLVPLYARLLGPAEFGVLEIYVVTSALLVTLLVMGFNSAIVRYAAAARSDAERVEWFRSAWTVLAGAAGVLVLSLVPAAPLLAGLLLGESSRAGEVRLVLAAVYVDTLIQLLLALFRAELRPGFYAATNLGRLAVILVLNFIFVGLWKQGVPGALFANLAGGGVGLLVALLLAGSKARPGFSRERFRTLARFGMPLVVAGLGLFIMNSSDRFFLKATAGLAQVGIYSLGYKIGLVMSILLNAFVAAWPPIMMRIAGQPDAPGIFSRVQTYFLMVAAAILVVIGSFGREFAMLLGGASFAGAGDFAWLILLSYAFQGIYYIQSASVGVTEKTAFIPLVVGGAALVNLAANFLLIPRFGVWGAAWATLLSFMTLAFFMDRVAARLYPIPWEVRRVTWLALLAAAALAINLGLLRGSGVPELLGRALVVLAVPPLLLLVGFFTEEERTRARLFGRRFLRRPAEAP